MSRYAQYQDLKIEVAAKVATVTLNRPEAMNAMSKAMRSELYKAMVALDGDPDVSVVVLTGAGERGHVGSRTRSQPPESCH